MPLPEASVLLSVAFDRQQGACADLQALLGVPMAMVVDIYNKYEIIKTSGKCMADTSMSIC